MLVLLVLGFIKIRNSMVQKILWYKKILLEILVFGYGTLELLVNYFLKGNLTSECWRVLIN